MQAYKNRLLIRPEPEKKEVTTTSGILVERKQIRRDGSDVVLFQAEVVGVGPETFGGEDIKPGDTVYYNSFNAFSIPGTDLAVLDEVGIYALDR